MTRLIAFLFVLTLSGAMAAPPRIALVRITDIYQRLPSTKTEQAEITALRGEILKDRRAEELRKVIVELKTLQAEIQKADTTPGTDLGQKDKLAREYEIKRNTFESIQRDFETFRDEQNLEINRKMVVLMRASLDRISAEAKALGAKKGFDWVIDSSGNTNTGVPLVLYAKDAPDLTDEIVTTLSPSTPTEDTAAQGTPTEKPAPAPPTSSR